MLYILFCITFLFLLVNFIITDGDYLHPSTLFCEMFFLYELICIIGQSAYAITLHAETILVFICGFLVFTIFGITTNINKRTTANTSLYKYELNYIHIPNILIYLLILLQIITNLFFIRYLRAIAVAYGSGGGSLGEMINLYDTMTKFWTSIFNSLNVPVPMAYRIGNPVTGAAAWIILYVEINNFMVCRKVKFSHLLVIALMCVNILLNGSRSPLLRAVTFAVIMFYVLNYRKHGRRKGSIKIFFRLISIVLLVSIAMIALLFIMGRADKLDNIWGYLFTYTGAPIVNLDTFLNTSDIKSLGGISELFGEHTFKALYSYIGKIFGIAKFVSIKGISKFSFSSNGIEIGNVYTTFYTFVYDFGYIGVFPLICIVAWYYTHTYRKVLKCTSVNVIDFRLFIFAYLFNDLIMLTFSNRFFETVCDAPFIKLLILSWLFDKFIFEHSLKIGYYRLQIPAIKI